MKFSIFFISIKSNLIFKSVNIIGIYVINQMINDSNFNLFQDIFDYLEAKLKKVVTSNKLIQKNYRSFYSFYINLTNFYIKIKAIIKIKFEKLIKKIFCFSKWTF